MADGFFFSFIVVVVVCKFPLTSKEECLLRIVCISQLRFKGFKGLRKAEIIEDTQGRYRKDQYSKGRLKEDCMGWAPKEL
jgi:hypothetical protein